MVTKCCGAVLKTFRSNKCCYLYSKVPT